MKSFRWLCCALAALVLATDGAAAAERKPNILFIAVDDLNHWVRHLGRNRQTLTPHIDRLASRGVTFTRAYCAAPACNPSRTALMSGLRPSTSSVYLNGNDWRPLVKESLLLNAHFRKQGYQVAGAGKIFHGSYPSREWDNYSKGGGNDGRDRLIPGTHPDAGGIRFGQLDADDSVMNDHHVVSWCIDQLQQKHEKPLFLACGIYRPHMPWQVPKKYFDLYPLEKIELPPFKEDDLEDVPPYGLRMAKPEGDHATVTKAGLWKHAIQAYLASITFADAQVGRLIEALDRSVYRDNTLIVLWGDHGWHLGEKRHWRKFSLWEEATRAPLIWVAPGVTQPGGVCHRTVDFMSIYPTLCDLAGVPVPAHVEGGSLRKLLADPEAGWDRPALTTHGYQNHAVRTERWRYIRYENGDQELYDHARDPYEWENLAQKSEFEATISELSKFLPPHNAPAPR